MSDDIRQRAVQLLLGERHRQVTKENWSEQHDDTHTNGALALAGASYAIAAASACQSTVSGKKQHMLTAERMFPFEQADWWKPSSPEDPVRDLVKAGALILAEIERVLRKAAAPPPIDHVRCNQCREIVKTADIGMAFNMGNGPVYICSKCAPPANAEGAVEMLEKFIAAISGGRGG